MIPRIVHQIWLGPDKPLEWMDQWRTHCDHYGWDYRLWGESDFGWFRNQHVYDWYMRFGHYPGAADVARVEVLFEYGGWYIDADAELVDPEGFFNHSMHDGGFVCADHFYHPHRYLNGMLGSEPRHPITARYLRLIGECYDADELTPPWDTIGGTGLFKAVNEVGGATVVPMRTFIDQHFGKPVPGVEPNLIRHHQYSTRKGGWHAGGGSR